MKWGLCSHFNPLISFLGKKKLRKPNYIFNPKMVNLFQYKTQHYPTVQNLNRQKTNDYPRFRIAFKTIKK
jgi:hypothetical protein